MADNNLMLFGGTGYEPPAPPSSAVNTTPTGPSIQDLAASVVGTAPLFSSQTVAPSPAASTEMDLDSEIRKATAEYLRLYPADQAAKRAAQGAQAGYAQKTADAYRRAAATPMPQAPLPQYKALPEPPKPKYREPWEAVGNVFSGLMLVAGLATRRSGEATLNAASAAMQAQQQGDEQGYQDALAYFKENYARTIDSNNQERQKYEDIWKNEKLTWDAKMARIEAEATANKNMAVAAAARGSRADDLASYIGVLNNAKTMLDGLDGAFKGDPEKQIWHTQYQAGIKDGQNQGLTGTALKQHALQYAADKSAPLLKELKSSRPGTITDHERNVQARMEVEKSKPENAGKSEAELRVLAENQIAAARGRQPTVSALDAPELRGLEGKEYLAKLKELNPGIGATVEKVARGDEAFPKGRDPVSVAVRAAVNIADPNYTEATFPIIKNTMADYRNVKVPGTGGILAAGNLVGEHAVSMKKAAQEMRNGNFRTLNQLRNYLQSKGNFPALSEYEVFKSVVARETDRFTAGARPTVTETKEWRHVLDGNATPQELEAVSNALLKEVLLPKFKILGRAYNTGVFAVDDNNEPDQNNPRYKPWTFWASPRWRDIADQSTKPTVPSSGGLPSGGVTDEQLEQMLK